MASMVRGEAVKVDGVGPKVRAAVGQLKSPAYIVEHRHDNYRVYAVPGNKILELIAEGHGLSGFVRRLGAFDVKQRSLMGGYAARLSEGKIIILDGTGQPMDLTKRL